MAKIKGAKNRSYVSDKHKKLKDVICKMPELSHINGEEEFSYKNSACIQWLVQQEEVLNFLWEEIKLANNHLSFMEYDKEKQKWKGVSK